MVKAAKHPAFDLDDPKLPAWIEDNALASGGYPYDEPLKRKAYKKELPRCSSSF